MKTLIPGCFVVGSFFAIAPSALAQERYYGGRAENAAPSRALELGLQLGYNQGIGRIRPGRDISDLSGAGGAIELQGGYRFNPNFVLGVYGDGARYAVNNDAFSGTGYVYSAAAGAQAGWHFLPFQDADPWVTLGTGWRGYWAHYDNVGTDSLHGLDMVRGQVGVDLRAAPDLSISPVIGASASLFLTEAGPGTGFSTIASPRVNTFLFGGVMARFDVGGSRESETTAVAQR